MKPIDTWRKIAFRDKEIFGLLKGRRFFRYIAIALLAMFTHLLLPWIWTTGGWPKVVTERVLLVLVVVATLLAVNSVLLVVADTFKRSTKHENRSIKGLIQVFQVLLFCVGIILVIAILMDKSPKTLIAGLGASTAVLMLVFRDAIVGFVSGVQLTMNDMVRIGDWITLKDGSADGVVTEMTINTVKIRNWDNTIATVPPSDLMNNVFFNWRGMQESGGRRVNKVILVDLHAIRFLSEREVVQLWKLLPPGVPRESEVLTNTQLYRIYIEHYLMQHPQVNPELDLIIAQKEPTAYGLPIQVYFFVRDKRWQHYERIQSDIFDHLLAVAPRFGVRLYQAE